MLNALLRVEKLLLVLALLVATGCSSSLPLIQDSYETVTLTPLAEEVRQTPTPAPEGAAQVAQTFYRAWEAGNYLGMYSLLSPQSQALVDSQAFVDRYERALQTATVQAVRIRPLAAAQDGGTANVEVQVEWDTAVLGTIVRVHSANLVYSQERWGIVWNEGLILPELAGGNQLVLDYRAPSRANIYDRNGKALAYQGSAILLGVVPGQIQDEAGMLAVLSPLLGKTADELREMYAAAELDWYVPLGQIPSDVMQTNYEALRPFIGAGLTADERLTRIYTNIAPHVVGYLGAIPPERAAEFRSAGYQEDARIGLAGLEAWGEPYLSGTRGGVLTVVDGNGRYISTIAEGLPRQARSVYTTFEVDFQKAVEEALAEAIQTYPGGSAGAAVVLDVNSGAVLAMASFPSYDPSAFDTIRPNAQEILAALFTDERRPLFNRALQGGYPAGSVFKIVTFTAALQSGLYNANTRYNSTGIWNRLGENYVKTDWREGGHGNISLRSALVVSCNTCFYDAGFTLDAADPYLLPRVAHEMGFGQPTGIVGAFESPGTIPDPDWKVANTAEGGWVPGDAVNMAIGQGYVQVTPLQVARTMAAVANGGTLYRPLLVDRVGEGGGAPEQRWQPEVSGQLPITAENLDILRQSLRDVAVDNSGTANFVLKDMRVPVAGKTGTAQTPQPLPHAWFAGYAPAAPYTLADGTVVESPQIAVAVIMENAGEGSAVAAPIFRRIVELYYGIQPLTPYPW